MITNKPQISWFLLLLNVALLSACQAINPMGAAETNAQRAYAAYGTFVIFQEKAADLVEDPNVSRSAKLSIINADERAKPVADNLLDAYADFLVAQAEFMAGRTTEEKLLIASNNLNSWVTRFMPTLNDLIRNVKGVDT